MLEITKQKNYLISFILSINILCIILASIFTKHWYVFLILLGLSTSINTINIGLILGYLGYNKLKCNNKQQHHHDILPIKNNSNYNKKCLYVLPCYNENKDELLNTINSIIKQTNVSNHNKILIIICDGKIKSNSHLQTNEILINDIFKSSIVSTQKIENAYKSNDNNWNDLEISNGQYENMDFMIIVKENNKGKRDSLTLLRRLAFYYNKKCEPSNTENINDCLIHCVSPLLKLFEKIIDNIDINVYNNNVVVNSIETDVDTFNSIYHYKFFNKIDYIIGTDADTILDNNCSYELIKRIESESLDVVGVVGLVDIF
jgi:chitin synthase